MNMRKRIKVCLVIGLVAISSMLMIRQAEASSMSDIGGHWAEDEIEKLADVGVVSGYPDGTFKPEGTISNAEFLTLLVKSLGGESIQGSGAYDVGSHWVRDMFSTAVAMGIVDIENNLIDEGRLKFYPDQAITREDMAVMVAKGAGLPLNTPSRDAMSFTDMDHVAERNKAGVLKASSAGMVKGFQDGSFGPVKNATRAEATVVIGRMMEYLEREKGKEGLTMEDIEARLDEKLVLIENLDEDGNLVSESYGFVYDNDTVIGLFYPNGEVSSVKIRDSRGHVEEVMEAVNFDTGLDLVSYRYLTSDESDIIPLANTRLIEAGDEIYFKAFYNDGLVACKVESEKYKAGMYMMEVEMPLDLGSYSGFFVDGQGRILGSTISWMVKADGEHEYVSFASYTNNQSYFKRKAESFEIGKIMEEKKNYDEVNQFFAFRADAVLVDDDGMLDVEIVDEITSDEVEMLGFELMMKLEWPMQESLFRGTYLLRDDWGNIIDIGPINYRFSDPSITYIRQRIRGSIFDEGQLELDEGRYRIEFFNNDKYFGRTEFTVLPSDGFEDLQIEGAEIKVFDGDKEDNYIMSVDKELEPMLQNELSRLAFGVRLDLKESFSEDRQFIFEIERYLGNELVATTPFTAKIKAGEYTDKTIIRNSYFKGVYTEGDYRAVLKYGNQVLAETQYTIIGGTNNTISQQTPVLRYYAHDTGQLLESGKFNKLIDVECDLQLNSFDVEQKYYVELKSRSQGVDGDLEVLEESVSFIANGELSGGIATIPLDFIVLDYEIEKMYNKGANIFLDVYVNHEFIGSVNFEPVEARGRSEYEKLEMAVFPIDQNVFQSWIEKDSEALKKDAAKYLDMPIDRDGGEILLGVLMFDDEYENDDYQVRILQYELHSKVDYKDVSTGSIDLRKYLQGENKGLYILHTDFGPDVIEKGRAAMEFKDEDTGKTLFSRYYMFE